MSAGAIAALIIGLIGAVIIIIFISRFRVVSQGTARVVQRLGKYHRTLETGLKWIMPFIDKAGAPIVLKEQVADFRPSEVITKDNVKMMIDSVVFFQVVDPRLFTYGIERPMQAIENLTATTLRNIVGELELDETLTSRETVNTKMQLIIDDATNPWGIKIHRVELRNILPPPAIQESMEKQMRAERERRQTILQAEGEKRANILVAEGEKQAAILRAEATKIALLTEAEGQAQAIRKIVEARPDASYITLQGFDALKAMAEGQSNTLIIPSDLQNVTTLFSSISETLMAKGAIPRPTKPAPKAKTTKPKA
ncbi:MAG: SPFH/Band 7/PHB domain protein [Firmicutes bacterium]|nr:SPFH/Band 7/PHB domain protein [Bacillota bacterium]